jgi:subtilase family serine protease
MTGTNYESDDRYGPQHDEGKHYQATEPGYDQGNGAIDGLVWLDVDDSGKKGNKEAGLPAVVVTLHDAAGNELAQETTDENGRYHFANLSADSYQVCVTAETLPESINRDKYKVSDHTADVRLHPGEKRRDVNFGYHPGVGSIGDLVWIEQRNWLNRTKQNSRAGLAGVAVTLSNRAGIIRSMETNSNGRYIFHNLPEGNYTVSIDPDTLPEKARPAYSRNDEQAHQASVCVEAGKTHEDIDFGYYQRAAVPWLLLFLSGLLGLLVLFILIFWPRPQPDLVVHLVGFNVAETCEVNGRLTEDFQVVVSNVGNRDINQPFVVTLSNGETQTVNSLAAGAQTTLPFANDGDLPLDVVVDAENNIAERYEDNNAHVMTVALQTEALTAAFCAPDLAVSASCNQADRTINAFVENRGGKDFDKPFTVLVNGKPNTIDRLNAGERFTLPVQLWDGRSDITTLIENESGLAELNPENNTVLVTGCQLPPGMPDLTISIMGNGPTCESPNGSLQLILINSGSEAAGPFVVQVNGAEPIAVEGLASGTVSTLSLSGAVTYPVTAVIDENNEVDESNEDNNQATFILPSRFNADTCPQLPDLTVEISVNSSANASCSLATTTNVTVVATVTNLGDAPVNAFTLQIAGKDVEVTGLGANASTQVTTAAPDAADGLMVTAVVDTTNSIEETDETNNEASATLTLATPTAGSCDLIIATDCTYNATDNAIDLIVRTTNVGSQATGPYWVQVNNQQQQVPGLRAGQPMTATFQFPLGTANFIAHVDATNQVSEINEANNRASLYLNQQVDGKCGAGSTTTRIDFEIGLDAVKGVREAGMFRVFELNGYEVASWYGRAGEVDSGWMPNARISGSSVLVYVEFYPNSGGAPIRMEILNPAPNSEYGWLTQGKSHALEIQYPVNN